MEGSSIGEKDYGQSTKSLKISEVNKDFISNLPDSILLRILSFLPLRDAIKTVLLRRFGKLWLSLPVLKLDHCSHITWTFYDAEDCDYDKFMDIIHQVWNHDDHTTLEKLRLKLYFRLTFSKTGDFLQANRLRFGKSAFSDFPELEDKRQILKKWIEEETEKEKAAAHQIERLLVYALSREVRILDLDFKGCADKVKLHKIYELPNVLRSNYLRNLELTGCDIISCVNIYLQALKVLSLREVLLNDETMEQLLLGCPLLEDLSIYECYGLDQLNCESPNLKKLLLSLREDGRHLSLSCPHAVSLRLLGLKDRVTLLNVSSLVDASVSLCRSNLFENRQRKYAAFHRLLLLLQQCETISLCDSGIAAMSTWKLRNLVCPSFNWKKLDFQLDLAKCHLPGLSFLFKSCPYLETLTIAVFPWFGRPFKAFEARFWRFDFDGEKYLETEEVTLPCLKSVLIYGNVIVPYMIQLVQFLLKNAPNLQKMEISTKKWPELCVTDSDDEDDVCTSERRDDRYTSEQMLEFSHKLTTSPRASSQAMIYFE